MCIAINAGDFSDNNKTEIWNNTIARFTNTIHCKYEYNTNLFQRRLKWNKSRIQNNSSSNTVGWDEAMRVLKYEGGWFGHKFGHSGQTLRSQLTTELANSMPRSEILLEVFGTNM